MKFTAWTEHETIAEANTMKECLNKILSVATIEDVIDWNIWITKIDEVNETEEDFSSTEVYDLINSMI